MLCLLFFNLNSSYNKSSVKDIFMSRTQDKAVKIRNW